MKMMDNRAISRRARRSSRGSSPDRTESKLALLVLTLDRAMAVTLNATQGSSEPLHSPYTDEADYRGLNITNTKQRENETRRAY